MFDTRNAIQHPESISFEYDASKCDVEFRSLLEICANDAQFFDKIENIHDCIQKLTGGTSYEPF